jgi:sortase B
VKGIPRKRYKGSPRKRKSGAKIAALVAAITLCGGALMISALQIIKTYAQRQAAGQEYGRLRSGITLTAQKNDAALFKSQADTKETAARAQPLEINPDYVGWLLVGRAGAAIDYPVVQGADNVKYLTTTFEGNTNPAGAIFMDCRNTGGFASRHAVLYGHNMKDGGMFGGLKKYRNAGFLNQNAALTVTPAGGGRHSYRIFSARVVNAWDFGYQTDFLDDAAFAAFAKKLGAPYGTTKLLTLSTCTDTGEKENRLLVHAALIE